MELRLEGKTALVTGASMGIGRYIAAGLAREGVAVAVAARRIDLLESLRQQIKAEGAIEPVIIEADLTDAEMPKHLAKAMLDKMKHVDILINAAGGSRPVKYDAPAQEWESAMMLNFFRLRELTTALIPNMIHQRWGRIINLTGTSEPRGSNATFPAKAAVHVWAKGLSREIGQYGITVNSIQPGSIISEQLMRLYPTEDDRRRFCREVPVGRFGEPAELGDLAIFLASPLASYITGAVIPVDGGRYRFAF
ncbi:MAG: SDR family oxidoreductase [Betaproteobacteria bacterium]|nr:SDR family oxidoreductase [Betaproteobacteria bacterium]